MNIEYIRNVQFGYMRIDLTHSLSRTEEEMLERNRLEGMLPVLQQKENNKYLLRYDITGKQALDNLLENTMVDQIILKNLLVGIGVAIKQLEKHLLWQEGLLLTPETIFWDARTKTVHFCYYPEVEEPLQVRLTYLMEYILAKTDHKNIQAVQLAYDIYEIVQDPLFCISNIQEYFLEKSRLETEIEMEEVVDRNEEKQQEQVYERIETSYRGNAWGRIMGWIKEQIQRISRKKQERYSVNFELDEFPKDWEATKMLNGMEEEIKGILKYEGTNLLADIVISKVPFSIGSAKECDGIINYPTISKCHARITNREGVYFIEDSNSTNGTKINGGLLSYKTKVSLKKGDSIYFANEPYRFL